MLNFTVWLTSIEETTEIAEDVYEYSIDDVYRILSSISDKLDNVSGQLTSLQEIGSDMLQLLQGSYLDSVAALLLILVGFEIMRLVRGWTKGDRYIGRSS